MRSTYKRPGLILLVVLGMLSLFSMLAISYVVFASNSRTASMSIARRDFRGTPAAMLLDDAVMGVLRGTTDTRSAAHRHDLLGDIYGQVESPFNLRVRERQLIGSAGSSMNSSSAERPMAVGSAIVRIPIVNAGDPVAPFLNGLPTVTDVWTGRVVTFLGGPLQNRSFRIVRSIGDTRGTAAASQLFSILLDFSEIKDEVVTASVVRAASPRPVVLTQSIAEWIANDLQNLFYQSVNGAYSGGWPLLMNAVPFNGHGAGVTASGTTQFVRLADPLNDPAAASGTSRGEFPVAFQPNLGAIATLGVTGVSDSDESYDAPDYQNFFLYHRFDDGDDSTPLSTDDIIPSFHRAALIHYLVNESDPRNYSQPEDLIAILQRIQAMTGRPLSYNIRRSSDPNTPSYAVSNPNFSGSNSGAFSSDPAVGSRIPQLNVIFDSNWATNGLPAFQSWLRQLTRGPWDVDNDDDGINDSIWTDLNLPLITSPEGKLLKTLVAFQIEGLDSRLDMNAVGNAAQANNAYANQTTAGYAGGPGAFLTQGFGFGPAEASLRHLFPAGNAGSVAYLEFLRSRSRASSSVASSNQDVVGRAGDDLYSIFSVRETPIEFVAGTSGFVVNSFNHRWRYQHGRLPGLPLGTRGRHGLGTDLYGSMAMINGLDNTSLPPDLNDAPFDERFNDPYETGFASDFSSDSPFTFADWERLERLYDQDRASLSRRINGYSPSFSKLVTPRSRHLRYTPLASYRGEDVDPGPDLDPTSTNSLYQLLRAVAAMRPRQPPGSQRIDLDESMFLELFPLEFNRAEGLNLNRALGNGIDDDGDGQFDEPEELALRLRDNIDNDGDGTTDEIGTDTDGDGFINPDLSESQRSLIEAGGAVTLSGTLHDDYLFGSRLLDPSLEEAARPVGEKRVFSGSQTRQLLARHLYCLAMLLVPDPFVPSNRGVTGGNPTPVSGAERARMLAQWAVNVVDFRDADATMTRFPYDPAPFVDKNSGSGQPLYWRPRPAMGEVVWGLEQPELIMTETLATHDLRVRDTQEDSSGDLISGNNDDDYDQLRLPEGSGFIELRALRTTGNFDNQNLPGVPPSLYSQIGSTNQVGLNLNARVRQPGTNVDFPVWRIAISEPHSISEARGRMQRTDTPLQRSINPDLAERNGMEYQFPNLNPNFSDVEARKNGLAWNRSQPSDDAPRIDRLIWFTDNVIPRRENLVDVNLPPEDTSDPDNERAILRSRVYDNRFVDPVVIQGGQHLVVGPRAITYFGSKQDAGLDPMNPSNQPSNHRIVLQNNVTVPNNMPDALDNWATVYRGDNNAIVDRRPALTTNNTRNGPARTLTMRAATVPQWDPMVSPTSGNLPETVGFNVSAPHPTLAEFYLTPTDQLNSDNNSADPDNGALGFGSPSQPADAYHDYDGGQGGSANFLVGTPFDGRDQRRYPLGDRQTWGIGYEEGVPIPGTVEDWCTAYLQRLADPERPWHAIFNPYITVDWMPFDLTVFSGEDQGPNTGNTFRFASRQKTGELMNVDQPISGSNRGRTFLSIASETRDTNNPSGANASGYWDVELPMDLPLDADPSVPMQQRPTSLQTHLTTFGYLNSAFRLRGETSSSGATGPWVTGYEGAPADVPANLTWMNRQFANVYELASVPVSHPGQLMQEFSVPTSGSPNYYDPANRRLPFSHLMNWFQPPPAGTIHQPLPNGVTQFVAPSAIFELATTGSPWSDANKYLPAASVANSPALASLHAPYNQISRFVEPGRVNINTIQDPRVWQGLVWNLDPSSVQRDSPMASPPGWPQLTSTLKAYASAGGSIPNANPRLSAYFPTQFRGVFKSPFEAGFTPPLRSGIPPLDEYPIANPINTTVARGNPDSGRPLFALPGAPQSNAFNEFQYFSRLEKLTTTRSNVFAIRATIGYFEYDPATGGLGVEYGEDQGTSRRHRAFYVVDRSIPVGYQEGQDHNVKDCILVRRIIE